MLCTSIQTYSQTECLYPVILGASFFLLIVYNRLNFLLQSTIVPWDVGCEFEFRVLLVFKYVTVGCPQVQWEVGNIMYSCPPIYYHTWAHLVLLVRGTTAPPPPSPRPAPPSPPLSSFCVGLLTLIPVLNAKLGLPPETLPFAHAFRENLKESRKMCVVGFVFGGWGVAMSNFFSVILRLKPLVLRTFLRFPRMQGGQSNDYGNRG